MRRHLLLGISTLLLGAAGLGCSAGRDKGQACTDTRDCRPELLCFDGECTSPGSCPTHVPVSCGDGSCCPAEARVCCKDGNCYPSSESCRAATCVEAGKSCNSPSDCCLSLTCQLGRCAAPPTRMTWEITNNCFTGGTVSYRFFDRSTDAAVPITTIASLGAGKSATATVPCRTGAKVCFGGRDQTDGSFYGVDIDGAQGCTGCCETCAATAITLPPLSCP